MKVGKSLVRKKVNYPCLGDPGKTKVMTFPRQVVNLSPKCTGSIQNVQVPSHGKKKVQTVPCQSLSGPRLVTPILAKRSLRQKKYRS